MQKEILTRQEQLRQEMKDLGTRLFKEGSQDIFDTYPDLVSFSWVQYTPYFNDGDECVFGVDDYSIGLAWRNMTDDEQDDADDNMWEETFYRNAKYADPSVELPSYLSQYEDKRWLFEAGELASGLISGVDEATMKDLFGDHVKVTVTRDGIDTEYYDHD